MLKFTIAGEPVLDGRYQLEKRLGQGGMGVVFKARHIFLKTQHAIKIILPDLVGNDPSLATRFRQEAMAAAAVHHPNTISVTDFGIVNGTMPFLVMEFIEGPSLHEILQREKRLPPARALEIMLAVCAGVSAAHGHGIVHRDLKPLNIILKIGRPLSDAVKVLDFGLAKIKSGELLGSFVAAQTQGMMGSPFYMAPEQWSDEEVDVRADIYSLGVILYQMLAGDVPFRGNSVPSIMKKHLTDPPPPLSERGVHVPPAVEAAVQHALAKDPEHRPASVEEFMEELRAALVVVNAEALTGEAGTATVQIGGETLELLRRQQSSMVEQPAAGSETVASLTGVDTDAHGDGSGASLSSPAAEQQGTPGARDTAEQRANRTAVQPDEESEVTRVAAGDPARAVEDEAARQRVEEQRRLEEEEEHTRVEEARQRAEAEEAQRREAEAESARRAAEAAEALERERLEAEARERREAEEGERRETAERVRLETEAQQKREAEEVARLAAVMYSQWPAHSVTVKPFAIGRTEVTGAEYAEFVRATKHRAPPDWAGDAPKAGEESLPVRRVSFDDAWQFAVWRSHRDGVTYHLPTEEQWEYAARGGDAARLFPWGGAWEQGRANLGGEAARPVGSFPSGATPQGVQDMIGNVSEWTSSPAAIYDGNKRMKLPEEDRSKVVVRGGSYRSKPDGDNPITATTRSWVAKDVQDQTLGFRLVQTSEP
ncbi:MAG: SUMF1/EgtB/PvdO family nonheme iron enzyme [Acidobacteria bacterium]|nr:SUMF1/EgtB/PvdO family nonheme iron enzyme [Acidobacteriota bacterium]